MGKLSTFIGLAALAGVGFYVGKKIFEKKKNEETAHVFESDSEIFVEEKHSTPKEKLQKASFFAVGALKTGSEKFKEGIDEIINSDMIAKGEATVADTKKFAMDTKDKTVSFAKEAKEKTVKFAKEAKEKTVGLAKDAKAKAGELAEETSEVFKSEIDSLKDMVSSINVTPAEEQEAEEESAVIADADAYEEEEDVSEVTASSNVTEFPVSREESSIPEVEPPAEEEKTDETEEAADDIDSISLDSMDTVSIDTFDFGSSEQL